MVDVSQVKLMVLANGNVLVVADEDPSGEYYRYPSYLQAQPAKDGGGVTIQFFPVGVPLFVDVDSIVRKSVIDAMAIFDVELNYQNTKNAMSRAVIDDVKKAFAEFILKETSGLVVPEGTGKLII